MDRYKSWDNMASSFYAADKIIKLVRSPHRESSTSVIESNYSTIVEILRIISEHSPGVHKQLLSNIVGKSDLYNNTYRSLKTEFSSSSSNNLSLENISKTLAIIKPTLNNKHKVAVDKILKIYEIITS